MNVGIGGCEPRNQPQTPAYDGRLSKICIQISDMTDTALDLKAAILKRIEKGAARGAWTPRDFLDLGARDAVEKALQRMTRAGSLRRVVSSARAQIVSLSSIYPFETKRNPNPFYDKKLTC